MAGPVPCPHPPGQRSWEPRAGHPKRPTPPHLKPIGFLRPPRAFIGSHWPLAQPPESRSLVAREMGKPRGRLPLRRRAARRLGCRELSVDADPAPSQARGRRKGQGPRERDSCRLQVSALCTRLPVLSSVAYNSPEK